jgi:ribosomal-protein-alanine N-acetyltransferase
MIRLTPLQQQGLSVEAMTRENLKEVLQIEALSFTEPWSEAMFLAELAGKPFSHSFVVRSGTSREIVGYSCFWILGNEFHLLNLAISPGHRNQGIGEWLLRRALIRGKESGALTAFLEVRPSNLRAKRLYERLGFKLLSRRKNYYDDPTEDALILWHRNLGDL